MAVSVKVKGADPRQRELLRLADRVAAGVGPDGAGPELAHEVAAIHRERFESEGFGRWPRLSPATIRRRGRSPAGHYRTPPRAGVGPEGPILQWTGALKESLAAPFGAGSPNAVVEMRPTSFHAGTRIPYANTLTVLRPLNEFTPAHEQRLQQVVDQYIQEGRS